MRLIPYYYRPGVVLRRNSIRRGILGPSVVWKVVAAFVFGRTAVKRFGGRQPDVLGTYRVGVGGSVRVAASEPARGLGRRQRRQALAALRAQAMADVEAAQRSA